eukprot:3652609-Pleurochrysis_carterae.AAC.1
MVRRDKPSSVGVSISTWRDKIGNDVSRKAEKSKQAAAGLTFKVNPTPLPVFKQLHEYLCDLQPANGGRHITTLKQDAGQRGGDQQQRSFEIVSGDLVALFFKSIFVYGKQQGSVHISKDGTVLAVVAPFSFTYKHKLPAHENDPVLTVTVDIAALRVDGVWRFDEESAEYSTNSKEHMKRYISRQLRIILDVFQRMTEGSSSRPI